MTPPKCPRESVVTLAFSSSPHIAPPHDQTVALRPIGLTRVKRNRPEAGGWLFLAGDLGKDPHRDDHEGCEKKDCIARPGHADRSLIKKPGSRYQDYHERQGKFDRKWHCEFSCARPSRLIGSPRTVPPGRRPVQK